MDKAAKGKEKSMTAVKNTEAFRDMTEHFIPLEVLCAKLETNLVKGLTEETSAKKWRIWALTSCQKGSQRHGTVFS